MNRNITMQSNLDDNNIVEYEKSKEINGWTDRKQEIIEEWRNELEYQYIVNWFFLYELKRTEGLLSWAVIVISTITSTFSLIELDPYIHENWIKGATAGFSIFTTLAASYIKKENYIDRIKNIDRHLQQLLKIKVEINSILSKMPWDRMSYESFIEVYEDKITEGLSGNPSMSPEEFKKAVWSLTKYYPELINNVYPWYKRDENGEYYCTEWGRDILRTYDAVYYSRLSRRLCCCYYCRSECCKGRDQIKDIYKPEIIQPNTRCSIWPNENPTRRVKIDNNLIIERSSHTELNDIKVVLDNEQNNNTNSEEKVEEKSEDNK
jgi:hypothetical protein